ncbi:MAG: hypothetical protein IPN67_00430 [Bacteroidales bacterium]|nr:hypothetical protein [Bacteroidales bacterium]
MQQLTKIVSVILLIFSGLQFACTKNKPVQPFFPGDYPGKVSYTIAGNSLTLSNEAITGEWGITDNSVFLKSVTNKYDGQTVNLEDVLLFAIELDGGKQLTNLDFKLKIQT